jgi:LysR family transcriptional activator of mexEF-oprN operon
MHPVYERDLDLNLLRVFTVVAEERSVTRAAGRLYLTQPAVSAALRRLASFVGAALFARQGRGLVLTGRGAQLLSAARAHLGPLVAAAMESPTFEPATSTAVVRLGLSDSTEGWLLSSLLGLLRAQAPAMQLVVVPVTFRSVEEALLANRVDMALTVADELPPSILRKAMMRSGFVCVYDPRFLRLPKTLTAEAYFAQEHVVVSYAGDLRGVVEDATGRSRKVRLSLPSFGPVGDVLTGSPLVATIPETVARHMRLTRPYLRVAPLPFALECTPVELLWPRVMDEDAASRFVRELVTQVTAAIERPSRRSTRAPRRAALTAPSARSA